jgi:hypothetical protein
MFLVNSSNRKRRKNIKKIGDEAERVEDKGTVISMIRVGVC